LIEFSGGSLDLSENVISQRSDLMLAEKFCLVLETIRRNQNAGLGPRTVSSSPHIPIPLAAVRQEGDDRPERRAEIEAAASH
jgi:hypothetical protein